MDKYRKLTKNTFIFFVGEAGTKLAAFFMLRYYTSVLTTSEYGLIDLILTTASILVPIITLGINQGVFRFSMDRDIDRTQVLSIGLIISTAGNLLLLLVISVVDLQFEFWNYILFAWLICFTTGTKTIIVNYCRGIEKVKLFAAAGLIQSAIQIGTAIVLISGFGLRIKGYIYAVAIANVLVSIIVSIGIRKEFHFKWRIDTVLTKQMLLYSIPLIVQLIGWLLMSSIDKYVILAHLTTSDNGMYSAADKLPMLITTISAIFMRAWQMSSVDESKSVDKAAFYSKIFQLLHITLALASMVLLLAIRPIYAILVGPAFEGSWQYTPFLIVSAVFSSFASFISANYIAMKKTNGAVYTTAAAAVLNLILNIILTRRFGISGTAFATMLSYIALWILVAINTAKFVRIEMNMKKFIATYLLLLAQAFIVACGHSLYPVQAALIALMVILNYRDIIAVYQKVMRRLRRMR